MEYHFLYNLIFAGIIQGIFLSLFLLFDNENKSRASFYLGILILSVALANLQSSLASLEIITWDEFNLIYVPYLFLISPAIYFFVTTFLYPDRKTRKIELLLYLPFIVFLGIAIFYKMVFLATGKTSTNDSGQAALADFVDIYADFVNIFIILVTLLLLSKTIQNYSKSIARFDSKVLVKELVWIKVFLGIMFVTLIPWLLYTYSFMENEEAFFLPILVIASFVIYIWGYIAIHKIKILNQRTKMRTYLNENKANHFVEKPKNGHITQLETLIVENQGYLNPNLTLDFLADQLQLSTGHLSRIINTELGVSFNDYINSLRISEAKKMLLNQDFSNYTIVAIGLEAGFSSKTTFNSVFKKTTNQTPSQFRKSFQVE